MANWFRRRVAAAVVIAAAGFGVVAVAVPAHADTLAPSTTQTVTVQPTSGSVDAPVTLNDWWW